MTTPKSDSSARNPRPHASTELRSIALEQFASTGFAGTSLQQIADEAGYSKSSVLYHFASKEALLEEVLDPALDRLEQILGRVGELGASPESRRRFIEDFIDFLLEYRLEVHIFINQGQSLVGVAVIDRANAIISSLAGSFGTNFQSTNFQSTNFQSTEERIRFSVALGGAAYTLVAGRNFGGQDTLPSDGTRLDEIRSALITTVSELLAPSSSRN